jgi:hypothetical protein
VERASPDDWLTIGAVAERAGIAASSLRYYERQAVVGPDVGPDPAE